MTELELNDNSKFIQIYKNLSEKERESLYKNADFVSKMFSLKAENRGMLLLFLMKMDAMYQAEVYQPFIIPSLLKEASYFKIEFINRFCKNQEAKEKILCDPRILDVLAREKQFYKDAEKYGSSVCIAWLNWAWDARKYDCVLKFLRENEKIIEPWYQKDKERIKASFYENKECYKLFEPFHKHVEELTEGRKSQNFLLQNDLLTLYRFFEFPCSYNKGLLQNQEVINKMVQYEKIEGRKDNCYLFRHMMNTLKIANHNHDLYRIEQERRKEIEKVISSEDLSLKDLKECIVDYLFFDYFDNVMETIDIIRNGALESIEWSKALYDCRLDLLLDFQNQINAENKHQLLAYFEKIKEIDLQSLLSRLYKMLQALASQDLVNAVTNIENYKNISYINKVPIIELKGESFSFLIHKSRKNIYNEVPYEPMTSLSMIDENHIESAYDLPDSYIFGFQNIVAQDVIHMCTRDSFSLINKEKDIIIYKTPDYIKAKNFMEKTNNYNEIVVKSSVKPDFLITYDKVTEKQLQLALANKMKIVQINRQYYKNQSKDKGK